MSGPRIRVCAVIFHKKKILLVNHQKNKKSYWVLPGGGVEYGEELKTALRRELKEELNIDIKNLKLLFVGDSIPANKKRHIVDIYFLAQLKTKNIKLTADNILKQYKFFDLKKLKNIIFHPAKVKNLIMTKNLIPSYLGNTWKQ